MRNPDSELINSTLRRAAPFAIGAAILVGAAARITLLFVKPLWHDEIFTLTLARRSVSGILEALRVDSGPPLHYLLAKLVLLPFGDRPGRFDLAVRALSLAASLLHLPVFPRVARRFRVPRSGLAATGLHRSGFAAAALFSLFPLAADYAAEGRGYAVASLLLLLALERTLALRDDPRPAAAVAPALLAAGAFLTHYLAFFPLAGFAWLLRNAVPRARKMLLLTGGLAALGVAPWLPVMLRQPPASLAWSAMTSSRDATRHAVVNLAFGLDARGTALTVLFALALPVLAVLLWAAARGPLADLAGVLAGGILLLTGAQILTGALVLPERTALPFLPLMALLAAAGPPPLALGIGAAAAVGLCLRLPAAGAATPPEMLARLVLPSAREGRRVAAVGLWGLELDYRLRRAGLDGRVVPFPSELREHPGWFRDESRFAERYRREAGELVASSGRPTIYVLPHGFLASRALEAELRPLRAFPVFANPYLKVVAIPSPASSGGKGGKGVTFGP